MHKKEKSLKLRGKMAEFKFFLTNQRWKLLYNDISNYCLLKERKTKVERKATVEKYMYLWHNNFYNNANFKKLILALFLKTKTVCCLCFTLFSMPVTWPAIYGYGLTILKTFPMEKTWPSILSVEVRVSKMWWLDTFHSNNVVVKSLPS